MSLIQNSRDGDTKLETEMSQRDKEIHVEMFNFKYQVPFSCFSMSSRMTMKYQWSTKNPVIFIMQQTSFNAPKGQTGQWYTINLAKKKSSTNERSRLYLRKSLNAGI